MFLEEGLRVKVFRDLERVYPVVVNHFERFVVGFASLSSIDVRVGGQFV